MTLSENIRRLVNYGLKQGLIPPEEEIYSINQLLEVFGETEYREPEEEPKAAELSEILDELLNEADELSDAPARRSDPPVPGTLQQVGS